ncbi:MAG: FixH family protein [bacterium]
MKAGMGWPVGVVVILVAFVVSNLVLMRLANDDPAMAIEPDYYRKAVAFDSTMAQERRSNALGWKAISAIAPVAGSSAPVVTVTLTDSTSRPIQGATVVATARFNARANDVQTDTLREATPGVYTAPLAISFAGQWEVDVTAVRGTDRFVARTRTEVRRAASGAR